MKQNHEPMPGTSAHARSYAIGYEPRGPRKPLRRWGRQGVRQYAGSLAAMRAELPRFDHAVGGASSHYVLVQHDDLVGVVCDVLGQSIDRLDDVPARLTRTADGTRMELQIDLPFADITPDDRYPLVARVQCLNSVDRSTRLGAAVQWYRPICSNGMWGWRGHWQATQHRWDDPLGRVARRLERELDAVGTARNDFNRMLRQTVSPGTLRDWVDVFVSRQWGPVAATNVYQICTRGVAGDVAKPHHGLPHEGTLVNEEPVPGACAPVHNLYHVGQALSWVASHLDTLVHREFVRHNQIPRLLELLAG